VEEAEEGEEAEEAEEEAGEVEEEAEEKIRLKQYVSLCSRCMTIRRCAASRNDLRGALAFDLKVKQLFFK
jgi:hypothetical protein